MFFILMQVFDLTREASMNGTRSTVKHHNQGLFVFPRDMNKLTLVRIPEGMNIMQAIEGVGSRACNVCLAHEFNANLIKMPPSWETDDNGYRTILCAGSIFQPSNGEADYPRTSRLVAQLCFRESGGSKRISVTDFIFDHTDVADRSDYLLCFRRGTIFRTAVQKRRKKRKKKTTA